MIKGTIPTARHSYQLSQVETEEVKKKVMVLIEHGLIHLSCSPYAAPVIVVKKKNGGFQMCIDYGALNKITVKDKFPLPIIDDILETVAGHRVYIKLDLCSGYHQLRLRGGDEPKTAFVTPQGQYEWLVLPFGCVNGPPAFSHFTTSLFCELSFVVVYIDDILIFSKTPVEHIRHVHEVLEILHNNQLFAKPSKCEFGHNEVQFVGHVVGCDGISVDPRR